MRFQEYSFFMIITRDEILNFFRHRGLTLFFYLFSIAFQIQFLPRGKFELKPRGYGKRRKETKELSFLSFSLVFGHVILIFSKEMLQEVCGKNKISSL